MRFTRIKVTEKTVELDWTVTTPTHDTQSVELESANRPMPALLQAMAAFRSYVVDLLDLPAWGNELRVTTINLDDGGKSGRRGLIVTAVRPIEKASGRVLVLNTPRMSEGAEDTESEHVLDDDTIVAIARAESAALAYVNGEREQTELPLSAPPAGEGEEQPAPVTGKKRRAKKGDFLPEVGVVSGGTVPPMGEEALRSQLLAQGRDVPLTAIAGWVQSELDAVRRWLTLPRSDEPAVLVRDATPSLLDDHIAASEGDGDYTGILKRVAESGEWTQETPPPKAEDVTPITA